MTEEPNRPEDPIDPDPETDPLAALTRSLTYGLSLPERALRSSIGLTAGAAREAANLLVPKSFHSSKTYTIVIRNSLDFLAENIGGAKRETSEEEPGIPQDFVARKTVGNFVDLASLATLHVSPLWLLAIASDVAYGSKTYVEELARELEKKGLISDTSSIHHVDDVLDSLQKSSGTAAELFDTPPLSVDQLRESLVQTKDTIASTDYTQVLPKNEIAETWEEMRAIATREDLDLLDVSGAMTLYSLDKIQGLTQGAITGVSVAGGLFNRTVLGHYACALQEIRERGFYVTLQEVSTPYIDAVWNNFSTEKKTLTEDLLKGKPFRSAFDKVKGIFGKKEGEQDSRN